MIGKTISHYCVLEKVLSPRRENAHLRRVVTEAAWAYRHRPAVGGYYTSARRSWAKRGKRSPWKPSTPRGDITI